MKETVVRPLWRSFEPSQLRAAVRHAKAGGISVVKERQWQMLGDAGPPGEPLPLMVDWAIRAIETARWAEITDGVAKGLVQAAVTRDWRERVTEWIARDAAFEGPTAPFVLDCETCGACCVDNAVVLDAEDLKRFRDGGRADLLKRTSRKNGVRLLPLAREKPRPCIHLKELRCSIYPVRPNMCRDFPAGTEQCLTSREDLYGHHDLPKA
ncbi:MAG: YkgJ family cysteine cluster protein [Myxococcales bacterium]|nr:YkgJ family cysteine cluster protein [Myxococcales bacterium]